MKFNRMAVLALALLVAALSALPASAAMGRVGGFGMTETANQDLAGEGTSIAADQKPDAEFTASISGTAGAISAFSLKNLTTGQEWATSGSQNVLVVVDSKNAVVNSTFPGVAFLLGANFKLYVNDRAAVTAAGGEFELTARFLDNSTSTARTTVAAAAPNASADVAAPAAQAAAPATGSVKVISSSFQGRGNYDLTNDTKKLGSNMAPDYRIDISLAGAGDTLTGVRIRSTGGSAPDKLWDTVPTTSNPFVAVSEQGKGTPLNAADGSISIPVKDLRDLSFWFDGDENVTRQDFRLTLLYTNGRIEEIDIKQAAAAQPSGDNRRQQREARRSQQTPRVIVMKAKPVQIKLDVVGKNRNKQASKQNDFSLMLNVRGDGRIEEIAVENLTGSKGRWDTIPGSNAWLTLVRKGGAQVNDPKDFSLSVPVSGNDTTLELLMENDGSLGARRGRLKVSMTWDDGDVTEETLTW